MSRCCTLRVQAFRILFGLTKVIIYPSNQYIFHDTIKNNVMTTNTNHCCAYCPDLANGGNGLTSITSPAIWGHRTLRANMESRSDTHNLQGMREALAGHNVLLLGQSEVGKKFTAREFDD